jgi:hypothetical protein
MSILYRPLDRPLDPSPGWFKFAGQSPANKENTMNEDEYVKVKKEDLIKVHKESCGDVKKVLEGLYPGEFFIEKLNPDKLRFEIDHFSGCGGFAIHVLYDGDMVGYIKAGGIETGEYGKVKFSRVPGYGTVMVMEKV